MEQMTSKEFCDKLREAARAAAKGEVIKLPVAYITMHVQAEDAKKLNSSYIRTIMNRVPEVKEVGSVSVKKKTSDDGAEYYEIAINRDTKLRIVTTNDLPAIKEHEREKLVEKIMRISPDFSHLDDEKALVAMRAVATFKDLIKEISK